MFNIDEIVESLELKNTNNRYDNGVFDDEINSTEDYSSPLIRVREVLSNE